MAVIADSTSFKTSYPRSLARRLRLSGFGEWWKRELAAAMPERLRTAFERRRARPVLAFDGNVATLWRPAQANGRLSMREVARIGLDGDVQAVAAAGRNALAPLAATDRGVPRIVVALSPRSALRKTLTLPLALEEHLRQSLAYDLDRHTPFKPEELYFDAVIVDRDSTRNVLRVDLAAARRAVVDAALRQAESFGARVVGVSVDPPAAAAASRLDLMPGEGRLAIPGWTRWQVVLPATLLALGVLTALVLPIWQKREQAIALLDVSDHAHDSATVSDRLRTELERRVGDYNFALERKYAFPATVQVLEDITRILPDDTWLTQLEMHTMRGTKDAQREVTLRGESANAGRLVSLLEDSKVFTQAAPRSPTTKIQPGPGEIFDVSAHLKPLPPPTLMPIEMMPPVRPQPAPRGGLPGAPANGARAAPAPATPGTAGGSRSPAANAAPAAPGTGATGPASTASAPHAPGAPHAPAALGAPGTPGTLGAPGAPPPAANPAARAPAAAPANPPAADAPPGVPGSEPEPPAAPDPEESGG